MHGFGASSVIALATLAVGVTAQLKSAFQWGWGYQAGSPISFEECQTLPVVIMPLDSNDPSALGVGPYYMLAFEIGGIPTTSMIGNDPADLWWQANHKQGSSLMLTVIDSNGNTGGVPQPLYTMTAGSDTSCLLSLTSSSATVNSNVSDTLSTCEPCGLTISGGEKPYTIVLAEAHSATITVVTLGDDDDTLTYINRAAPDWRFLASVYDATRKWGTSSNAITTTGSVDTSCVEFESSQSSSTGGGGEPLSPSFLPFPSGTRVLAPDEVPVTPSPPAPGSTGASSASGRSTATITTSSSTQSSTASSSAQSATKPASLVSVPLVAGISAGVGIPLLMAVVAVIWFCTRRRRTLQKQPSFTDMFQSPLPAVGYMHEADSTVTTPYTPSSKALMFSHSRQPSAAYPESAPFLYSYAAQGVVGSMPPTSHDTYNQPRSAAPTRSSDVGSSIRGGEREHTASNDFNPYATAFAAPPVAASSSALSAQNEKLSLANERMRKAASPKESFARPSSYTTGESSRSSPVVPEEIIVQHQDSGAVVVRELPPAYAGLSVSSSAL